MKLIFEKIAFLFVTLLVVMSSACTGPDPDAGDYEYDLELDNIHIEKLRLHVGKNKEMNDPYATLDIEPNPVAAGEDITFTAHVYNYPAKKYLVLTRLDSEWNEEGQSYFECDATEICFLATDAASEDIDGSTFFVDVYDYSAYQDGSREILATASADLNVYTESKPEAYLDIYPYELEEGDLFDAVVYVYSYDKKKMIVLRETDDDGNVYTTSAACEDTYCPVFEDMRAYRYYDGTTFKASIYNYDDYEMNGDNANPIVETDEQQISVYQSEEGYNEQNSAYATLRLSPREPYVNDFAYSYVRLYTTEYTTEEFGTKVTLGVGDSVLIDQKELVVDSISSDSSVSLSVEGQTETVSYGDTDVTIGDTGIVVTVKEILYADDEEGRLVDLEIYSKDDYDESKPIHVANKNIWVNLYVDGKELVRNYRCYSDWCSMPFQAKPEYNGKTLVAFIEVPDDDEAFVARRKLSIEGSGSYEEDSVSVTNFRANVVGEGAEMSFSFFTRDQRQLESDKDVIFMIDGEVLGEQEYDCQSNECKLSVPLTGDESKYLGKTVYLLAEVHLEGEPEGRIIATSTILY